MSPETRYKIEELEKLTGLSRRLIYDYISRELVAPAMGSGKGAYYLAGHYERLRLISLLRTMGFRLERIEEALQSWSPEEISRIVGFAEGRDMESLDALNEWLTQPVIHDLHEEELSVSQEMRYTSAEALDRVRDVAMLRGDDMAAVDMVAMAGPPAAPPRESSPPGAPPRPQTWHRVQLTPDIEINYRPDIDPQQRARITELIERAKELFNS